MKYECTVLIDACVNATIEADSPEDAAQKMEEHECSSPRLCHQCSREVNLGDPIGVIVNSANGMTELLDTSLYGQGKNKAKEQDKKIAELTRQLAEARKDSELVKDLTNLVEQIFASTYPYREDGSCTFNDSVTRAWEAIKAKEQQNG